MLEDPHTQPPPPSPQPSQGGGPASKQFGATGLRLPPGGLLPAVPHAAVVRPKPPPLAWSVLLCWCWCWPHRARARTGSCAAGRRLGQMFVLMSCFRSGVFCPGPSPAPGPRASMRRRLLRPAPISSGNETATPQAAAPERAVRAAAPATAAPPVRLRPQPAPLWRLRRPAHNPPRRPRRGRGVSPPRASRAHLRQVLA